MFPILQSDHTRGRKMQAPAHMGEMVGDAPQLDLGKKVSTPQDLMVEELSLRTNRGSQLFQRRQKRVQKFILEHPASYRPGSKWTAAGSSHSASTGDLAGRSEPWMSAEGKENYRTELHLAAAGQRAPPHVPKKTDKVLQMSKALNPGALAPGYSGPLHEVPPEKFNYTAIPKGYLSPWQESLSSEDYQTDSKSTLSELPGKPNHLELRSFNRRDDVTPACVSHCWEDSMLVVQCLGDVKHHSTAQAFLRWPTLVSPRTGDAAPKGSPTPGQKQAVC